MRDTLWLDTNDERMGELETLASQLGTKPEALMNEALDLLLILYKVSDAPVKVSNLFENQHNMQQLMQQMMGQLSIIGGQQEEVQQIVEVMVDTLSFIHSTTLRLASLLRELGIPPNALEVIALHYQTICERCEIALNLGKVAPGL